MYHGSYSGVGSSVPPYLYVVRQTPYDYVATTDSVKPSVFFLTQRSRFCLFLLVHVIPVFLPLPHHYSCSFWTCCHWQTPLFPTTGSCLVLLPRPLSNCAQYLLVGSWHPMVVIVVVVTAVRRLLLLLLLLLLAAGSCSVFFALLSQ